MTDEQTGSRQDVHDATDDDRLQGILLQVAADRTLTPTLDVRTAVADRLHDQGIEVTSDELDQLVSALPTSPADKPGPFIQGE